MAHGKARGGMISVVYTTGAGSKPLKSRFEVMDALGLLHVPKFHANWKSSRLFHGLAVETRERAIISQQLIATGGRCGSIFHKGDKLVVYPVDHPEATTRLPPGAQLPTEPDKKLQPPLVQYPTPTGTCVAPPFVMGNCAVLDWGRVVPDNPHFCSPTAIFPLGFKCILQEQVAPAPATLLLTALVPSLSSLITYPSPSPSPGPGPCPSCSWLWLTGRCQ
jgi:hypothetical protein